MEAAIAKQVAEDSSAMHLNLNDPLVYSQPFPFVVARNVLDPNLSPLINNDFPKDTGAGYLPYDADECGYYFNQAVAAMVSPEFADQLGDYLGVEKLSQYPTYVSISKRLNKRHGRIHTDGHSKIATALLYLNNQWADTSNGCLRFLTKIDDFDSNIVPEIEPLFGTLAAFKRTDCSYHGHLPFKGERRVIQVAWLQSSDDKQRKAKRGRLAQRLKTVFKL